tara:strand:- start:1282 stop:3012 length:1731 start_codon:yes stop_codon:yes gene_type:complete
MILESILQINNLVNKRQKIKLIMLSGLLFIGMILEAIGIAILVPLLQIISNQDNKLPPYYLEKIALFFDLNERVGWTSFFLCLLIAIYIVKNMFLVYLYHKQNTFLNNLNAYISVKLFRLYLIQPYNYFSKTNTSDLIKRLTNDTSYFTVYCRALLSIVSELGLLIAITISILLINPLGAISIGFILFILSYIYYYFSKLKMKKWGNTRKKLEEKMSNITLESLKGIKDLIVYQKTKSFGEIFKENKIKLSIVQSYFQTLSIVPRYYIELISVISLVIFIFLMIYFGKNLATIIPTLGVFLAATIKMTPSVNKIITSFQNLKYYGSSINILVEDFKLPNYITENRMNSKSSFKNFKKIIINNLNFKHENSKTKVLNEINIEIKAGTTIGIIGKSGEGKSTLIDVLVGLFKPTSGDILIDGKKSIYKEINEWRSLIGYVPQNLFLLDSTIAENIAFGQKLSQIDYNSINSSIERAHLTDLINSLPDGFNTKVGESGIRLSGGQKQRVAIARALYNDPDILILDEATSSLDKNTEKEIMKAINSLKKEKTIIIIAHRFSTLKDCDLIYELKNNKLEKI